MKNNPSVSVDTIRAFEPEPSILITGDGFLTTLNRVMKDSVDYTLLRTSANMEAAATIKAVLNDYVKGIKTNNFFLMEHCKKIVTDIQNDPSLFYYFKSLDHLFITNIQSVLESGYSEIVDMFLKIISANVPKGRDYSFLNDDNYLNSIIDTEHLPDILVNNSILFTIYFFSVAFPFSATASIA